MMMIFDDDENEICMQFFYYNILSGKISTCVGVLKEHLIDIFW